MDYQSNGQSGNPQNTGKPYNNTADQGNSYANAPTNNGNPYGNASAGNESPYGNAPAGNGNPYGNAPAGSESPYGNTPAGNENPYGNAPAGNGIPYGNPCNNTSGSQAPYGNMPSNEPYYGGPYNNTNPYNTPYNNPNPYYNENPYGGMNAKIIYPQKNKGEGMATAAMILGIISLVSLVLLRVSIPFLVGGVGIILAVLSKGSAKKMIGKAKAGMICCITGLVLDIVLCAASVYLVFALPDLMPELMDEVNKVCEEQYGISYDEMMDEIYEMWDIER